MQETEILQLFMEIWKLVGKRFGRAAAKEGFSMTEGLVLWHIQKHAGCKASAIAEHHGLPPSTMTGVLDRLESGGWITRELDPEDRRATILCTTPKLKNFMKSAKRNISKDLDKTFETLPPGFMPRFYKDLAIWRECLLAAEEEKR